MNQSYRPLALFDDVVRCTKPAVCPVCSNPIRWMRLEHGPIVRDIAIDPMPAGRSGDYRLLDDGISGRLKTTEDLATGFTQFHAPHARNCARTPFE
jgi:hypothetical protein